MRGFHGRGWAKKVFAALLALVFVGHVPVAAEEAVLLFKSGFEDGTSLSNLSVSPRRIVGTDHSTGFSWDRNAAWWKDRRFNTEGSLGKWDLQIVPEIGPHGNVTNVFKMLNLVPNPGSSNARTELMWIANEPPRQVFEEGFVRFWAKLPEDYETRFPAGQAPWWMFMEWKEPDSGERWSDDQCRAIGAREGGTNNYRVNIHITDTGEGFRWLFTGEHPQPCRKGEWEYVNTAVPTPPGGEWFLVEAYFKHHYTDGRVYFAINGEVILDTDVTRPKGFTGRTQHADNPMPLQFWSPFKQYHDVRWLDKGPMVTTYDDFELWSTFPEELSYLRRQVRVEIDALSAGTLSGPTPLDVQLYGRDEFVLAELVLSLDGKEIYRGAALPADLVINQGELADGPHELLVTVTDTTGTVTTTKRSFKVANSSVRLTPPGSGRGAFASLNMDVALPASVINRVEVLVGDELVHSGAEVPKDLLIDTRSYADGPYTVVARVIGPDGGVLSSAAAAMLVRNWWTHSAELAQPVNTGWFGTVDASRIAERSAGWQYVTAEPESFFNDRARMVCTAPTDQYLVWDMPGLRRFSVVVFAKEKEALDSVVLALKNEAGSWQNLGYSVEEGGVSPAGWRKLLLSGEVPADSAASVFRLLVQGGLAADQLQVGQVDLAGLEEWAR